MMIDRLLLLSGIAFAGALTVTQASAQMAAGGNYSTPRLMQAPQTAPGQNKSEPPPTALPGVKTSPSPVADAEKTPSDMAPNDALFDAINRGDTAVARDALNRGADLSATNVLGMTPLALAVDLGRDDISFILLSMRGAEPHSRQARATEPAPKPIPTRGAKPSGRVAATQERVRQPDHARQPAAAPAQFANDTGTPNPGAGFLGFGPR